MAFRRPDNRSIIRSEFLSIALPVLTTPTRLSSGAQQSAIQLMYETIAFCCPLSAANSVWIGGANIDPTVMNGQEVVPGNTIVWKIINERQRYELQAPLLAMSCDPMVLIPFKAWDVSEIYLVATANTTIGVTLYKGSLF